MLQKPKERICRVIALSLIQKNETHSSVIYRATEPGSKPVFVMKTVKYR